MELLNNANRGMDVADQKFSRAWRTKTIDERDDETEEEEATSLFIMKLNLEDINPRFVGVVEGAKEKFSFAGWKLEQGE